MNIRKLVKFENTIDYFLFFIIIFKLAFIFSILGHIVASHSMNQKAKDFDTKMLYWKERTEFIFVVCMGLLLVLIFNPYKPVPVDENSRDLFFLFGIILILTANWNTFFTEADWYKRFVNTFK